MVYNRTLLLIIFLGIIQVVSILCISNWAIAYNVVPGMLIVTFILVCLWHGKLQFSASAIGYWLWGLFAWLFLVGLWSAMPQTHYYFWGYLLAWPLVYWLYLLNANLNQHWFKLFGMLVFIALVSGIVAIYQYSVLHQIPLSAFNDKNNQSALANLMVFPCISYLLILLKNPNTKSYYKYLLGIVILILFVSVTISGSRAATLAAIFGLLFLAVMLRKTIQRKYVIGGAIIIALPILYGIFYGIYGGTQHSFFTLFHNPLAQGQNRFLLWQPAWQLILQHGLFGIGLGNFYWYLPAIKSALDTSAGLYVHNDYLQLLLEGGVVAFILLMFVIYNIVTSVVRYARANKQIDAQKIEVLGVATSLFTVFFHSLFSFNLFIMPILIPVALLMGRLHYLVAGTLQYKNITLNLYEYVRKSIYRVFLLFSGVLIIGYYFTVAAVIYLDVAGNQAMQYRDYAQAKKYFDYAAIMHPNQMELLASEVQLYNQLDKSANDPLTKLFLYQQLNYRFAKLTTLHPMFAGNYFTQAQYYQRNPSFAGKNAYCKVKGLYQKTLALWPLSKKVQQAYAVFIKKHGNHHC